MSPNLRAALLSGVCVGLCHTAQAQTLLPPIDIAATRAPDPITSLLHAGSSAPDLLTSSDTASLLAAIPGLSLYSAGGVSSLPALHGLGADRVAVLVDGVPITMACGNEMNPPLSYADPSRLSRITVVAGITPVSLGGDAIGGTIVAEAPAPFFASEDAIAHKATATGFYRSNAHAHGGAVTAAVASDTVSLSYTGAIVAAENYRGGGNDGVVRSTEYESANHAVKLAWRGDTNLVTLDVSQQYIPRQGFPNQWMDMIANQSTHITAGWQATFGWGDVEARVFWQHLRHEMNFLADKGGMASGGMPMSTRSETIGYRLKTTLDLSAADTLGLGSDFLRQALEDWWPAVPGSMMMGPLDYKNISDGKRSRLGLFAEWQHRFSGTLVSLLGVRTDQVWMNTGAVQPYAWTGMMNAADAAAATAFNAAPHARHDANIDVTALLRYTPDDTSAYEFGYARKSRAPNLYERYSWGRGAMSSQMIGWFGDGNGYVGNLTLKSEVAHTTGATADWHGASWQVKLAPYYTRVEDYVTAATLTTLSAATASAPQFDQLQFVNHEAELYGMDLSASLRLWSGAAYGTTDFKLTAGYTRGHDLTAGGALYHIMPVNAALALVHRMEALEVTAELQLAGEKSHIDAVRHEPKTGAYALLNLKAAYLWKAFRLEGAIQNVFDTGYDLPLGGVSLGDYNAGGSARPLPGMGRSFNVALTAELP